MMPNSIFHQFNKQRKTKKIMKTRSIRLKTKNRKSTKLKLKNMQIAHYLNLQEKIEKKIVAESKKDPKFHRRCNQINKIP
jgi:hypothetical protein